MKFFIASIAAISMLFTAIPAANANDTQKVVIGILGGALGGYIIGSELHRHRHRHQVRVYQDPYDRVCYKKWVWVWDDYEQDYVRERRLVCE